MAVPQYYPFDIKKFPEDDDDILLTEKDLERKNVVFCRQEIMQQMKCTQWAKEEYLSDGMDPTQHTKWFHYHLQKCYTPYMDAVGCLYDVADKEAQKVKREAGPEGWKQLKEQFINNTAKSVGENKARMMWELSTNLKEIHETTRQRDGHLFGEHNYRPKDYDAADTNGATTQQQQPPRNLSEAMGVAKYTSQQTAVVSNESHREVEDMFARATRAELNKKMMEAKKNEQSKPFWKFGL